MASIGLRREEGIGLAVAVALHAAVLAALMIRPPQRPVVVPPQRIEVTISEDVGLTSTSPDPFALAAPDQGPESGEALPPPLPETAPEPAPVAPPVPAPAPPPAPRAVERPKPAPAPKSAPKLAPKPAPRATVSARPSPPPKVPAKPAAKPAAQRKSSAIDDILSRPAPAASRSAPAATRPATGKPGAGSFADAFKDGVPGAKAPSGTGAPAAAIGPKQVSALASAINRQLKPHWQAPQGADADLLVTRVRFRLNADGSLAGEPQVLATTGQTAANQPQVQRHQEQAVRAVKLAAPFDLPADLYEGWKVVTTNFDRKLSQ